MSKGGVFKLIANEPPVKPRFLDGFRIVKIIPYYPRKTLSICKVPIKYRRRGIICK